MWRSAKTVTQRAWRWPNKGRNMSPWQNTIFIVYIIKCCVIDWQVASFIWFLFISKRLFHLQEGGRTFCGNVRTFPHEYAASPTGKLFNLHWMFHSIVASERHRRQRGSSPEAAGVRIYSHPDLVPNVMNVRSCTSTSPYKLFSLPGVDWRAGTSLFIPVNIRVNIQFVNFW